MTAHTISGLATSCRPVVHCSHQLGGLQATEDFRVGLRRCRLRSYVYGVLTSHGSSTIQRPMFLNSALLRRQPSRELAGYPVDVFNAERSVGSDELGELVGPTDPNPLQAKWLGEKEGPFGADETER